MYFLKKLTLCKSKSCTLLFIIVFFTCNLSVWSQNKTVIDSLEHITKTSTDDSLVMVAYNKLRRATAYNNQKASKAYTLKYLELSRKRKDSHNIVLAHFFLGNAQILEGKYQDATQSYLIGAEYYQKKQDTARLTSVYNSLGAVHEKTKKDSLSLYFYTQSRELSKKRKDLRRSGIASVNIGNLYTNNNQMDKAIFYLEDSVEDLKSNPKFKSFLNLAMINLANAYHSNMEDNKALDIYKQLNSQLDTIKDSYHYAGVSMGLSKIYKRKNLPDLALKNGQRAFRIFSKNNYVDECLQLMPDLIDLYRAKNRNVEALKLYDEYYILKDSLLSETNNQQITDAIQKYETEKKDAELKVLKLEAEKSEQEQVIYAIAIITALIIALIIAFFSYKNLKKNKLLAKQTKLLSASIDEKNILLQETHHRVKNSFQIVSSLLYLQSESVEDKEAKIAIKEAENRVRSMVLIHQRLYNKEELVGINTKDYFNDLVTDIFESHQFEAEAVQYTLHAESLILDIETITPIGLILNELIVNTLKHAFDVVKPDSKITIDFKRDNETLVLKITDNGKGFSGEVKNTSFGITLMKALSKKLEATLTYDSTLNKGTTAKLKMHKFVVL